MAWPSGYLMSAMAFWILACLLTFSACLAVLLPAVRASVYAHADADHDLAVYKDQLAELDRDVERGVIEAVEAKEARAEIARRILKAGHEKRAASRTTHSGRLVTTAAVLAVPLASWGIYAVTGSPYLPGHPLQARLEANPAESSIEELIARAEAHLAASPEDGRGWEVLAPIYYRIGRYPEAVTAWRNAIRLEGPSVTRELGLADGLTAMSGGVIVAEAHAALERALALDPENAKARFLLATALAQEGKTMEAEGAFRAMLTDLAPDSPWHSAVMQALAQAPSGDGELISDKDQAEMIDNMVAGLDQRLRDQPQDPEGWQRLVHSYAVLGRTLDANDALARGLAALGSESEAGRALAAFAAERGVGAKD